MNARILIPLLLALLLTSCAVAPQQTAGPWMIPGRMYCLKDGTEFQLSIERSSGQGRMTAVNLRTGEQFTGTYSAIITEGGAVEQSTAENFWGKVGPTVTKTTAATKAAGRGILRGDKGTVINLTLDIKPSYSRAVNPSGFGEGEDNNGLKYQIQFG